MDNQKLNANVKHPDHYNRGKIEVIQAMEVMSPDEFKGYLRGSALKYIYRLGNKDDPKQDGEKAKTYIDWLVDFYQKENK